MFNNNIEQHRKKIDQIDDQIFDLLQKRFYYAAKIGKIKYKRGAAIQNRKREQEMIDAKQQQYAQTEISRPFIKQLLQLILKESRRIQRSFDK